MCCFFCELKLMFEDIPEGCAGEWDEKVELI